MLFLVLFGQTMCSHASSFSDAIYANYWKLNAIMIKVGLSPSKKIALFASLKAL